MSSQSSATNVSIILKKYQLIHQICLFVLSYKLLRVRKQSGFLQGIRQTVQDFYLSVSRMTTDKNDSVIRIKNQRLILRDPMLNLHTVPILEPVALCYLYIINSTFFVFMLFCPLC